MKISELIERLQEFEKEYGDSQHIYFDNHRLRYVINAIDIKEDEYGTFIVLKEVIDI